MLDLTKVIEDKNKPIMQPHQREVRCPQHKCIIGKYDERSGIVNATYYCTKCKFEYTFTIAPKKSCKNR